MTRLIDSVPHTTIAAAAGWLAGRAEVLLNDRTFRDRVVSALVHSPGRLDVRFLTALDLDIRHACQSARRPAPQLARFFQGQAK